MKIMSILLCFSMTNFSSFSQNISGTWKGNFINYTLSSGNIRETSIYLILDHKNDSLTGHSLTIFKQNKILDTAVCVIAGRVRKNKVNISETSLVNIKFKDVAPCLQTMELRIGTGKNSSRMSGEWVGDRSLCGEGGIEFKKMKD